MTEPDAMKAAIETMLETVRKHDVAGVNFVAESKWCRCGWERRIGVNGLDADEWASEHARHHQEMILRALLDGGYVVLTDEVGDRVEQLVDGEWRQLSDAHLSTPATAVRIIPASSESPKEPR